MTKFNLTKEEYLKIKKNELKKIFNICYQRKITCATLFMTSHLCHKIYDKELFTNEELDWNLIFMVCFWLSTKFIVCDRVFYVDLIKNNLKNKYRVTDIIFTENIILKVIDYDFGHRVLWSDGIKEEDFENYL